MILRGWLNHRARLRGIGFTRGFQWCDGSFVGTKEPRDLDVVTFLYRPDGMESIEQLQRLINSNRDVLDRALVRDRYAVDLFIVDLDGGPEVIVRTVRYYFGLFSHRREDQLWKGMLEVGLQDEQDDRNALASLETPSSVAEGTGGTP